MASSPSLHGRQKDGDKVETVTDYSLGSKITVDGDCSHEIKKKKKKKKKQRLLLERKAMMNLDSVLKKQKYPFATKGLYSQSYGFFSSHV